MYRFTPHHICTQCILCGTPVPYLKGYPHNHNVGGTPVLAPYLSHQKVSALHGVKII